jgi:hypothetical protein
MHSRFVYQNLMTFRASHTLLINTNHRLVINETDHGHLAAAGAGGVPVHVRGPRRCGPTGTDHIRNGNVSLSRVW